MLLREVPDRQHLVTGGLHHGHRFHDRCHHVLASLRDVGEQVAQEVHPAQAAQCNAPLGATLAAALEHPLDRRSQAQVGV